MSSPLYLLLYSDGFIALFYSISHYPIKCTGYCRVLMLLLKPKWVVFVKHTMITYIEVQCCTVDDTIYTVKYCKKNKQTDDNMWLYFSRMTRRPSGGGRQRLFTQQQELAVVDLVRADNAIRLHQLRQKILADRQVFNNINHVSITTIRHILGKHSITMKQLYRVPIWEEQWQGQRTSSWICTGKCNCPLHLQYSIGEIQ